MLHDRLIAVLDVGKTLSKLSLWTPRGEQVARVTRRNRSVPACGYLGLDADGIGRWLVSALGAMRTHGRIGAIVPAGHGAAAVIVRDGAPVCVPVDYETPMPGDWRAAYDAERDPFSLTGSPALPDGLNLGAQLDMLERQVAGCLAGGAQILLWPQYWAWLLSGVAASELTSLGCHSDLWLPGVSRPSALAVRRGWADLLPPLRAAGEILGPILPEWARRTGLDPDVAIYCGLHDSNAALLAARGFREILEREATILSTGTWFVAMRTPAREGAFEAARLDATRDCLLNIDACGRPIPSARFMGGREIELLTGIDSRRIDIVPDQPALLGKVGDAVERGLMLLPTFAPGFGPFPHGKGRWIGASDDNHACRAAVSLYAALVADTSLELIGAKGRILIEGRFAEAQVFVRALARLRPSDTIYATNAHNDVSFGALRLIDPELAPKGELIQVEPLDVDLSGYRQRWSEQVSRIGAPV